MTYRVSLLLFLSKLDMARYDQHMLPTLDSSSGHFHNRNGRRFTDSPKVQTAASIIMTRWEASLHVGKLITSLYFFPGGLPFLVCQKYLVKNLVIIIYSDEFKLQAPKLTWNLKIGGL